MRVQNKILETDHARETVLENVSFQLCIELREHCFLQTDRELFLNRRRAPEARNVFSRSRASLCYWRGTCFFPQTDKRIDKHKIVQLSPFLQQHWNFLTLRAWALLWEANRPTQNSPRNIGSRLLVDFTLGTWLLVRNSWATRRNRAWLSVSMDTTDTAW